MRNAEEEVNYEQGPFYTFNGFNVSTVDFEALDTQSTPRPRLFEPLPEPLIFLQYFAIWNC